MEEEEDEADLTRVHVAEAEAEAEGEADVKAPPRSSNVSYLFPILHVKIWSYAALPTLSKPKTNPRLTTSSPAWRNCRGPPLSDRLVYPVAHF